MNILYGLAVPDAGEILLDGKAVEIASPHDAIRRGISMVHQHFMLVPVLSVAENILLGEEPMAGRIFLDRAGSEHRIQRARRPLRLGDRSRTSQVGSLSVGWQQRVEILKALYRNAQVLVLDEPTAVLTPAGDEGDLRASCASCGPRATPSSSSATSCTRCWRSPTGSPSSGAARWSGSRIPSETDEDDLAELMVGRDVELTVDRGESHPARAGAEHRQPHRPRRSRARVGARRLASRCGRARSSASPAWPATGRTSWSRRWSACGMPPAAR